MKLPFPTLERIVILPKRLDQRERERRRKKAETEKKHIMEFGGLLWS